MCLTSWGFLVGLNWLGEQDHQRDPPRCACVEFVYHDRGGPVMGSEDDVNQEERKEGSEPL